MPNYSKHTMAHSVDFKIVANTSLQGIAIVHSMNEDSFHFLTDELDFGAMPNGDVVMSTDDIEAFVIEAEDKFFYTEVV